MIRPGEMKGEERLKISPSWPLFQYTNLTIYLLFQKAFVKACFMKRSTEKLNVESSGRAKVRAVSLSNHFRAISVHVRARCQILDSVATADTAGLALTLLLAKRAVQCSLEKLMSDWKIISFIQNTESNL